MICASLAGTCYPAPRRQLLRFVREWFDDPEGAAWELADSSASATVPGSFKGVVAPHIDFRVNTSVYSRALAPALKQAPADKVLILGVGHRSRQEWSLDGRGYITPLGEVATDKSGLATLSKRLPKELWADPQAHNGEHSIEFTLIFLQALRQLREVHTPFTFVPVLCGGLFQYIEMGRLPEAGALLLRLAEALREWWVRTEAAGQRVEMVVSIDGCHMGPRFGHPYWVNEQRLKDCSQWEEQLWRRVAAGDLTAFLRFVQEDGNQRYFDGVGALALVLAMFGSEPAAIIERTGYAQWLEPADGSAVTFSAASVSSCP